MSSVKKICLFLLSLLLLSPSYAFMSDKEIASFQKEIADRPVGERIALWAEKFVGTPYDPDPQGGYVTKNVIVDDERVDCMYLSFRAVELAMGLTPEEGINIAIDRRFIKKGKIDSKGNVLNYEDRFQYGEDMLDSGKWGREITEELGEVTEITGSRGREKVKMISKKGLLDSLKSLKSSNSSNSLKLKDGDLIFFIKAVEKRKVGEIVGHIGIIKTAVSSQQSVVRIKNRENREIYLIHAGGVKNNGRNRLVYDPWATSGEVKKVRLYDYISSMPFVGVRVSRFD